jgi:hypothetical protein
MGDGLVGAWCPSFTGATGLQLADISGQANHGVLTGMDRNTSWQTSGGKDALDFDGVNDQVNLGSSVVLDTRSFTISFWAAQTGGASATMPIGNRNTTNSYVWFRSANYLRMAFPLGTIEFTSVTSFVGWSHYILTGRTSSSGLSSIGLSVNSIPQSPINLLDSTFTVNTLGAGYSGAFWFLGQIDDARIYNRPLTQPEIQLLYTGGRGAGMLREPPRRRSFQGVTIPRPSSNPVRRKPRKNNTLLNGLVGAWCPSLGANGTRLLDVSGRNNHGTLTSMDANTDYIPSGGKLALDFAGVNDYVATGLSFAGASKLIISAWIFRPSSTSNFYIGCGAGGSSGPRANIFINGSTYFVTAENAGGASYGSVSCSITGWNHFVYIFDGSGVNNATRLIAYINGNKQTLAYVSTVPGTLGNVGVFEIGRSLGQGLYGTGQADDIRIYNRALTATEVRQLYQGGRGYGLKQQRIKVGYTDPSPNLNKISIRKPKKKNTLANTLTTGLVGAWCPSLGPTGTRLRDVSGRNNDGTLVDMDPGTDWIPNAGKFALDFDGNNDRVEFSNLPKMGNFRTLSLWVFQRALSPGGVSRWFSLGSESFVIRERNGQIERYFFNSGGFNYGVRNTSVVLNKWQHYILRFDGVSLQLWVNGIFISSNSFGQVPRTNDGTALLSNTGGETLNGLMDDIRLYDRAIGGFEIDLLYKGGRGYGLTPQRSRNTKKTIYVDAPVPAKPKPAVDTSKLKQGLVGAWIPSLGPTGLRLEDRSPYKNHGTLTNMDPNTDWVTSGGYGALDFDGVDDYVAASNAGPIGTNIATSRCAWVFQRTRTNNVHATIIQQQKGTNEGFLLMLANLGGITFLFTDEVNDSNNITISGSEIPILNSWNHLLFQVTPSRQWSYFLNGNLIKTGSFAADIVLENKTINIGRRTTPAGYFDGRIDDIRIYNRALTAQEVRALHLGGRGYGFRPQRERYILGTETINTGGFKGAWYRRRPLMLGSGIQ